jgi:hypothetical protein
MTRVSRVPFVSCRVPATRRAMRVPCPTPIGGTRLPETRSELLPDLAHTRGCWTDP